MQFEFKLTSKLSVFNVSPGDHEQLIIIIIILFAQLYNSIHICMNTV